CDSTFWVVSIYNHLRLEFSMVCRGEALFNARNHLLKTSRPRRIHPRTHVRHFEIARQPLRVGHGVDVAEVRLGCAGNSRDDLFAAGSNSLAVTGDFIQQAASLGEGIVDFVDICPQLGAARGDAIARSAGWNPAAARDIFERSEEHTSELQSRFDLVCRL